MNPLSYGTVMSVTNVQVPVQILIFLKLLLGRYNQDGWIHLDYISQNLSPKENNRSLNVSQRIPGH